MARRVSPKTAATSATTAAAMAAEEQTPLLQGPAETPEPEPKKGRSNRVTTAFIFSGILVGTSSFGAFSIPATRLVEDIVCRRYYGRISEGDAPGGDNGDGGPIDERMCKVDSIQAEVAFLFAVYYTVRAVASMVTSIPWSIAADTIGRKFVILVAILGLACEEIIFGIVCRFPTVFPVELISVAPLSGAIGGAFPVLSAAIISLIMDLAPAHSRSTWLLGLHVSSMVGQLLSPAAAGAVVGLWGPWLGLILALSFLAFSAIIFTIGLPSRDSALHKHHHHHHSHSNAAGNDSDALSSSRPTTREKIATLARRTMGHIGEITALLRSPSLVLLISTALIAMPVNAGGGQFLNQFASKRYGVSIANTGYLQSAYGVAHLLMALVVLPAVNAWAIRSRRFLPQHTPATEGPMAPAPVFDPDAPTTNLLAPPLASDSEDEETAAAGDDAGDEEERSHAMAAARDLLLGRVSHLMLALGALALALAPSIPTLVAGLLVLSLGAGFNTYTRSLMAAYVPEEKRVRLYSLVGIAEELGTMYAHPFLAGLFALGMKLENSHGGGAVPWIGLPYVGVGALAALALAALMFVRLPREAM